MFYSFAGRQPYRKYDQTIIPGLGVGAGYLKADGDIIFTGSKQQRVDIEVSGPALAVSLFLEYRMRNLVTHISERGTTFPQGDLDYDVFGFLWSLGCIFGL